jgi:hypothetical protein
MASTGNPPYQNADWSDVLSNIDPFALASMGSTFGLTLCVIGAAWCVAWATSGAPERHSYVAVCCGGAHG